jgi:hypothetical protein
MPAKPQRLRKYLQALLELLAARNAEDAMLEDKELKLLYEDVSRLVPDEPVLVAW